jgi:uncharacterized protein
VSRVSEGRINALSQLVLAELKRADTTDLQTDHLLLKEIKAALNDFLQIDDVLDGKVRRKIQSLSRRVAEGSAEWDVLYRQYFEEEKRKLGR